jgi:hypothetical protein
MISVRFPRWLSGRSRCRGSPTGSGDAARGDRTPGQGRKAAPDEGLVADTDSGEALPLLAFILRQLAEGVPPGGTASLARYHDLGGVHGALTRHADAALAEAVRVSGLTEHQVLAGLTRLVTVDNTGRRARRRIMLPAPPSRSAARCRSSWIAACCSATPTTTATTDRRSHAGRVVPHRSAAA